MFSTTVLEVCEEKLVEVDIMPSFSINYGSNKCLGGVVFVTANFPNFPISSVEIIFPNRIYIYICLISMTIGSLSAFRSACYLLEVKLPSDPVCPSVGWYSDWPACPVLFSLKDGKFHLDAHTRTSIQRNPISLPDQLIKSR